MLSLEKKTKFDQIRDKLYDLLTSGKFRAGDRFYSENRLATMFGVARMTINKVLTVLENEGMLERIQGKGTFATEMIEKHRNRFGDGQAITIALISSFKPEHLPNSPYVVTQFVNYIDNQASEMHFNVNVYNIQDQPNLPESVLDDLSNQNISGIIVVHLMNDDLDREIEKIIKRVSVPVVSGDVTSNLVDSVDYDDEWIGWRGADYLMELGHKNISFLAFETNMEWLNSRVAGFQKACPNSRVVYMKKDYNDPTFFQELEIRFDDIVRDCDALMCANDRIAKMVLVLAEERHVKVPEQLSVVGVDDLTMYRSLNLTSFKLSGEDLAKTALEVLMKRITQFAPRAPTTYLIKPKLMERNSTTVYEKV